MLAPLIAVMVIVEWGRFRVDKITHVPVLSKKPNLA
jgi:hypothetical protein